MLAAKKHNKHLFNRKGCVHTCRLSTTGTGVTGVGTGPIPSKKVYSALSVLMIVQEAPSLITSLLVSLEHAGA